VHCWYENGYYARVYDRSNLTKLGRYIAIFTTPFSWI